MRKFVGGELNQQMRLLKVQNNRATETKWRINTEIVHEQLLKITDTFSNLPENFEALVTSLKYSHVIIILLLLLPIY